MTNEDCQQEAQRLAESFPSEKKELVFAVMFAFNQFDSGLEVTATCPRCKSGILVQDLSSGCAWSHSCECGACSGTMKGL
jgi:hypothetical protein